MLRASAARGQSVVQEFFIPLPEEQIRATLLKLYGSTGTSFDFVVSRAAWATNPGSVLAGAVEVSSTLDYGASFISPVGENVAAASMFEVNALSPMNASRSPTVGISSCSASNCSPRIPWVTSGSTAGPDGTAPEARKTF